MGVPLLIGLFLMLHGLIHLGSASYAELFEVISAELSARISQDR